MARDKKGRFCKEDSKCDKCAKAAPKAKGAALGCAAGKVSLVDIFVNALESCAADKGKRRATGKGKGRNTADFDFVDQLDKMARDYGTFTTVTVESCDSVEDTDLESGKISAAVDDEMLASLVRARNKMRKQQKEEAAPDIEEGTPIDWDTVDPYWVSLLLEVYDDVDLPRTEEELRENIVTAIETAFVLVSGYMRNLACKSAAAACKCGGKCGK